MDEASARIFFGQQEGLLHLRLKEALGALIAPLPNVTECIVDQYFINSKGERRRPDVRFVYHGKVFVLEIQLATTQRPIITERNDFYIGEGVEIIWITWNPIRGKISDYRASFIDIITDHNDNLFSVDESTFDLTRISGELKLRVNWWEGDDCKERIVGLNELVLREGKPPYAIARPPEWHELHKDEWYAAGHQKLITDTECRRLWAEIQQKLSQPLSEDEASTDWEVVSMISLLISLEHGVPVNSQQKNLTEMLHTFLTTKRRKPMARIVAFAIGATKNSSLLERQKTKELLSLALVERQVSKSSLAARVVRLLFPEWAKHRPTN